MGEIADGLINGDFDFYTGEYLGRGGGFPRTNQKPKNYKSGVTKWLVGKGVTDKQEQMNILREFVKDSTHNQSKDSLCLQVSHNWQEFIKWFNEKK